MKIYIFFVSILLLSCSSGQEKIKYDSQENLEKYISKKLHYDLLNQNNDALIIILQNENCICTDENVSLSKKLIESPRYIRHKCILILNGKDHKILSKLSKNDRKRVSILSNNNNELLHAGYIATTDRVIIYKNGNAAVYKDLHLVKPDSISDELL